MIEIENAQIEPVEEAGTYAKYEAGPLQAGYGVTIGNALRRVMLSSLEGAAVTSIQIRDVYHEFSTIPGVKEDVTEMVLNVKKLRLKSYAPHPVQLKLVKSGAGTVTAQDIMETADVEIVNPEQHLLTLDSDDVTVEMDLTVERGVGYLAAERSDQLPIGVIPVDAIFTPVRKVNYHVENTPREAPALPMRAYNSLKRNNIVKVGQLLALQDDDLLRMRNFGKKSLDEMKERLQMRGFIIPEDEPSDLDASALEDEDDEDVE